MHQPNPAASTQTKGNGKERCLAGNAGYKTGYIATDTHTKEKRKNITKSPKYV
jgi:hypothetical protein